MEGEKAEEPEMERHGEERAGSGGRAEPRGKRKTGGAAGQTADCGGGAEPTGKRKRAGELREAKGGGGSGSARTGGAWCGAGAVFS